MAAPSAAIKELRIVVAGAGMGGLACALALSKEGFKHIEVYETASNLGFVGAGIQLAPNMVRILDRLGCWASMEKEAVELLETNIRQGTTDAELRSDDLASVKEKYGYAHMVGHRSSLAGALFEACKCEESIKFFFSTSIDIVNAFTPHVSLQVHPRNGKPYTVEADVLLAADGIKSQIRTQILSDLKVDAQVIDTGQAAYRIMLKREQMQDDPELLELIVANRATRWIGEKRHIIAYPVSGKAIYNISTAQPDTNFAAAPSATYTTRGSKASMLAIYSDFCPKVQRMLNLVPEGEVCEWKLRVHSPLPTWVHGCVALVGDACHPTLPHLAQGAAQAIEDAAVLSVVLSRCPDTSAKTINKCLRIYESLRKERAETLAAMAAASGRVLHLGEGQAREERDKQFRDKTGSNPDKWADVDVQRMIYGHDCIQIANNTFEQLFTSLQ